jgi:hypothetical protein
VRLISKSLSAHYLFCEAGSLRAEAEDNAT